MKNDKRACIAFVCARKVNASLHKKILLDIGSYKYSVYLIDDWSVDNIRVFDMDRNSYIQGTSTLLYDYADGYYISIEWNNNHFQGFDYNSETYFSGIVENEQIQIFDYEDSNYYLYKLV